MAGYSGEAYKRAVARRMAKKERPGLFDPKMKLDVSRVKDSRNMDNLLNFVYLPKKPKR